MAVDGIRPNGLQIGPISNTESKTPAKAGESFADVFKNYLNEVNHTLLESEKMETKLATGEVKNLHDVTIAAQKASIALQLTVQVRDRAVEAYQEIMRMQV